MRVEVLDHAECAWIVGGYQFAVETVKEREHCPVVGEDAAGVCAESCARRILGQHADQLHTQALPLPGVVDHNREFDFGWLASRVLRHGDDARSHTLRGFAHEDELTWRSRPRDTVKLIR